MFVMIVDYHLILLLTPYMLNWFEIWEIFIYILHHMSTLVQHK